MARRLRVRDRVTSWFRNPSIMRAFFGYAVVWAIAATTTTVLGISVLMELYYAHTEEQRAEHVEVNAGPYIYDAASGELVPATPVYLNDTYDQVVFVSFAAAQENYSASAMVGDGWNYDSQVVDATMELLRNDPVYRIRDWGGNYTEQDYIETDGRPYDPEISIAVDDLPAYDERERAERAQVANVLDDTELGAGVMTSNVAYYVFLEESAYMGPVDWALRLAAAFAVPIAAYGGGAVLLFRRFYRRYISCPLAELASSANRIARQDLDFEIARVRGRELGRLSEVLERMRASLLDAQRELWRTAEERRRLNAAFAHDLRTPITVLRGTVEMARMRLRREGIDVRGAACSEDGECSGIAGPRDADASAGVDAAKRASALLDTLAAQVDRLEAYAVSMSRVGRVEDRVPHRSAYQSGYIAELLEEYARAYADSRTADVALSFQTCCEAAELVYLDLQMVEEVFGNVLANAFGHAREQVAVALSMQPAEGALADAPGVSGSGGHRQDVVERGRMPMLVLTVSDDGPGFSREALERGCDPYYGERKSAEHFGLGLHIARTLARRHGGGISLENREEGGARVVASFAVVQDSSESPA